MKALILAAGFGKRLRPITNTIPKSMVEVNGTPLLCNALNNVTACGITEIGKRSEMNGTACRYAILKMQDILRPTTWSPCTRRRTSATTT